MRAILLALLAAAVVGCELRPVASESAKARDSFAVILIEESGKPFAGRLDYRTSKAFHDALDERGHVWRMVDQDVTATDGSGPPADVEAFIAHAKREGVPRVYLASRKSGRTVWSGPPPATTAAMLELIKRHGG